jgi:uncharacterized phage protein (TIGR02220 family)
MSQLGYTWYPQDWWTSETFKRLKRFPIVRYTLRELFDLMYKEGKPVKMTRDFLLDDFNIELTDTEFSKLMEFIIVDEEGNWWMNSIRKRLSKSEASRENGKLGGRPPKNQEKKEVENLEKPDKEKTQKPSEKTQDENLKNPPLEKKEKRKEKENNTIDFSSLLSFINKTTGRSFKNINDSVKKKFNARLKDGYSKSDILSAIKNAVNNDYHKGNNFQYLTPEFFSRADTLDKYSEVTAESSKVSKPTIYGPWDS